MVSECCADGETCIYCKPLFNRREFGREVGSALRKQGLSYRSASAIVGLPHYTLHRVVTGKNIPDVETYLRIKHRLLQPSA